MYYFISFWIILNGVTCSISTTGESFTKILKGHHRVQWSAFMILTISSNHYPKTFQCFMFRWREITYNTRHYVIPQSPEKSFKVVVFTIELPRQSWNRPQLPQITSQPWGWRQKQEKGPPGVWKLKWIFHCPQLGIHTLIACSLYILSSYTFNNKIKKKLESLQEIKLY